MHSLDKLINYVGEHQEQAQIHNLRLRKSEKFVPSFAEPGEGMKGIESIFDFETKTGRGSGMTRIVRGADEIWKGYMMFTVLKETRGYEESVRPRRALGGYSSLLGGAVKGNWKDRGERQLEFLDGDPTVIIVGASKLFGRIKRFLDSSRPIGSELGS